MAFLGLDWNRHIQESRGPLGQKSPKSHRKVFLARSVKRVPKKFQITWNGVKKVWKSVFRDSFDTFLTLQAGRPVMTFWWLFGDFGAWGSGDSCRWRLHFPFFLWASPDPPTLAFLEKKAEQKTRVFLFAEPLKSLEKEGKRTNKARKIGKQKKQGKRREGNLVIFPIFRDFPWREGSVAL